MINKSPFRIGLWDPEKKWPFWMAFKKKGVILTTYDTWEPILQVGPQE